MIGPRQNRLAQVFRESQPLHGAKTGWTGTVILLPEVWILQDSQKKIKVKAQICPNEAESEINAFFSIPIEPIEQSCHWVSFMQSQRQWTPACLAPAVRRALPACVRYRTIIGFDSYCATLIL